jgi:hypothetical protein
VVVEVVVVIGVAFAWWSLLRWGLLLTSRWWLCCHQ